MLSRKYLIGLLILLALLLNGCGNETASPTTSIEDIQTLAAQTMSVQRALASPTAMTQAAPAALPSFTPSPTSLSLPTATTYTSYSSGSSSTCDAGIYLADITIPDYTEIAPGEVFVKTWSMQNTGSCTWTEEYYLDFSYGDSMDGSVTYLDDSVAPGDSIEISITLTAPDTEGEYTGYWQLTNADGIPFGDVLYVIIVVTEDAAATSTSTTDTSSASTSTPTTAPASTSTPTTIPTNTSTFTSVPADTATPLPTDTPAP